uniref:Extended synaptotagmin-3 n=1 Tax=Gasterosteus aculeatus aculeatus TaxID=481459 RepID=G3NCK4_GASAC
IAEKLDSSTVNRVLMEFLAYFGRAIFVLYPVYLTGYLGLSISWVLLIMLMATWWKKNRQTKVVRIGTAIDFVDNETQLVNKELGGALQMATWVHFPEVEKVDWVNKVLQQAWPFFGMYMEKLLKNNIQPTIRLSSPALKMFSFTKVHFGNTPLKITGMKVFTDEVDHRQVILDLDICYEGDVDIDAEVKPPITAGIKGLKFQGTMRVILEPLIGQVPLVGGVTFFFIRRPVSDVLMILFSLECILNTIMDIIASLMVLPNRMCVPLIDQVKVDQMRFPLPRGVVRVHLLEARDLLAMDTYMLGLVKGKSDPYATLRVGNRHFKSKIVKENLHPKWNEVYEFVVHEAPGQELEWFTLEKVQNGEVRLKLQWFSLKSDPSLLRESEDGFACAMLAVYLDNASNLPKDQNEITEQQKHGKHAKEARRTTCPDSFVEFSIDKDVKKSKVIYASKDPVWEQGFTFFVHNVKTQQLTVQVKANEKKPALGVLNIPLSRLLDTSDMTLDQRFQLERSGVNSQIKLKATLRVLNLEKPPPKIIVKPPPQDKQQRPQTNQGSDVPVSAPSANASSSPALSPNAGPAGHSSPAPSLADNKDGFQTWRSTSSLSNMRRYDSHSLLSENSIASSRFDLSEGASYPEVIRQHQGSFGEIQLTVRYASLRNKLIVVVNSCRDIFRFGDNGTDSYVRLYFLPDQSWIHRKRTHVKKRTVNPFFDHKFEFDVSLEEAQNRKLDVSVKNGKMFHSRERKDIGMVGSASLTLPGLKKHS